MSQSVPEPVDTRFGYLFRYMGQLVTTTVLDQQVPTDQVR